MKIEFKTDGTVTMSREEAMKVGKDYIKSATKIEVLKNDVIILRTTQVAKVRDLFDQLLEDLKKIED